jgi:hypothetical protein
MINFEADTIDLGEGQDVLRPDALSAPPLNECEDVTRRVEQPRTAREVIDAAIRENRFGEYLLYSFAVAFVATGLFALVWGVLHGSEINAIVGLLASALFWPAMSSARRTRKENIAIRLLEAPLARADTAKEAAETLRKVFDDLIRNNQTQG